MKKRLISIITIIALLLAITPVFVMASASPVTINTITDKNPGSSVTISGTTALGEVTIKVSRPDATVLYVDVASATSGSYSNSFSLPTDAAIGTYAVIVGQGSTVATATFRVVTASSGSTGGSGSSSGSTTTSPSTTLAPTTGEITSSNTTVVSENSVIKQVSTTTDGKMTETFTVKEEVKTEMARAITEGKTFVQITVATTTEADKTVIDIPAAVMQSSAGLGLAISTPNATLELPKALVDAFAQAGQELAITVEQGTATASTAEMSGVQGTEGAKVLGTPTVISTAIKGNTAVTLPLTGIDIPTDSLAQANFLNSLAIFAVHSDGGKQIIAATIIRDAVGKPIGISFNVDKFSTFAIIQVAVPLVTLTDIAGSWAEANINKLVASGAIKGYSDGTFKPNNNISRAEFATVLVKAFKLVPKSGKVFSDTENSWAKDYISTANAHGIINGYSDTSFGPDDLVTREQMAVMIKKAANLSNTAGGKNFTDASEISVWATDAVAAASANGIISGYPNGSFNPQGNATRAEAVTVIVKAMK